MDLSFNLSSRKSMDRQIMDELTRSRTGHIFLSPRPSFALLTAADRLGMTSKNSCGKSRMGGL